VLYLLERLWRDEYAGSVVEYAIVAAGIGIPAIAAGYAILNTSYNVLVGAGTGLTGIGENPP
jgi:Flp pilus assembly pilin Flp